jgi:hypothetical protein
LHVHMVKFDVSVGDGAATGWNYLSGPSLGRKFYYRWWVDEPFEIIFFHDHFFADWRQKHGLFAHLLVEPPQSQFLDPFNLKPSSKRQMDPIFESFASSNTILCQPSPPMESR